MKINCQVAKPQHTYNKTVEYLLTCSYNTNNSSADLLRKSKILVNLRWGVQPLTAGISGNFFHIFVKATVGQPKQVSPYASAAASANSVTS